MDENVLAESVSLAKPEWIPGGSHEKEASHVSRIASRLQTVLVALEEEFHLVPERQKKVIGTSPSLKLVNLLLCKEIFNELGVQSRNTWTAPAGE